MRGNIRNRSRSARRYNEDQESIQRANGIAVITLSLAINTLIIHENHMIFADNSHIAENGRQSRTREGYFMAEILGGARYIKNEIRGSETKSE